MFFFFVLIRRPPRSTRTDTLFPYTTLFRSRAVTGFLFAGDFLGLTARDTYACSAEALTPVRLCRFPRRKLEQLFVELPKLERRLLVMASSELAAAQDQLVLLGRKSATEKVASFLLQLSQIGRAPV